ncbi:hypothetical protein jhhlp_000153 [Lomentospora prolificans]|uniref:DUF5672 domain-containing protein n=1 Tax=Lomentospora prolificans TaxID=41688 RepID=A0A2N3NLX5_9PEZI|nr:hypothetical protein jhhlp_000153 [Lomentospora prolificans]
MALLSLDKGSSITKTRSVRCFTLLILVVGTLLVLSFGKVASFAWVDEASSRFLKDGRTGANCSPTGSTNINDGRPLAVVIETEATPNLIPLMLHFSNVLGPDWSVVLYTLEKSWEMPSSPAFNRAREAGKIDIRFLPPDTTFDSSRAVSLFLTKPWFWEQLQSAHRVLLWQTDSIICSKASQTVEEFFDYDLVGAPIDSKFGQGYNGGLSIRNPKLFLSITQESDFETSGAAFEDQWFFKEAEARKDRGVLLPSEQTAKYFAVETIYYQWPLGYHQPKRWQADKMDEIEEWCPEVKMILSERRAV